MNGVNTTIFLIGGSSMKKAGLSVALFLVAFIFTYLACCYMIPGWRIKLAADSATYFLESVKHMVLVKSLISLAAGLIASAIPVVIGRVRVKR